jgi:hypothetical protein
MITMMLIIKININFLLRMQVKDKLRLGKGTKKEYVLLFSDCLVTGNVCGIVDENPRAMIDEIKKQNKKYYQFC